ncbi:hypothetical protein MRX96_037254 [Rhipicephalus microplus]
MTPLLLYSALAKGLAHLRWPAAAAICGRVKLVSPPARRTRAASSDASLSVVEGRRRTRAGRRQGHARSLWSCVRVCDSGALLWGRTPNALRLRDKARPRRGSLDCNTPAVRNSGSALRRRRR